MGRGRSGWTGQSMTSAWHVGSCPLGPSQSVRSMVLSGPVDHFLPINFLLLLLSCGRGEMRGNGIKRGFAEVAENGARENYSRDLLMKCRVSLAGGFLLINCSLIVVAGGLLIDSLIE